ncbi:hypothetical protein P9112_013922 [Eukaryota sp. TZLM1-RC]
MSSSRCSPIDTESRPISPLALLLHQSGSSGYGSQQHFSHENLSQDTSHCTHQCSPFNWKVGVKSISIGYGHTLLLTHSGEVYGWGDNEEGQVLYDGPSNVLSPIKLPLTDIVSISAGYCHSLALSSVGKLFGWGFNEDNQLNISEKTLLPLSIIDIPFQTKEISADCGCSFALTPEGQVVQWGCGESFDLLEDVSSIVFISAYLDSIVAVDLDGNFCFLTNDDDVTTTEEEEGTDDDGSDCFECVSFAQIPVGKYVLPTKPSMNSFLFVENFLFIIDFNGEVLKFNKGDDDVPFNNKPTKVPGLNNIVSISGYDGIYAAIDNNGKVYLWGWLSRLSDVYEDSEEPRCIEAFNNIEGISVGYNFLFAYNKNTVWAWGRNDKGQLGTGDLIDRPQPVKVFGSEILGSFHYPNQPLDRMFSGLIKLVYWEYLFHLQKLFGNHPYTKARFHSKCGVSKIVAEYTKEFLQFTKGGFNQSSCVNPIKHGLFLKDPQDLTLAENICDLQLRFSSYYKGSKVINSRIKKLYVYYDLVDHDPQLLSFFPSVEVVELGGKPNFGRQLVNLAQFSNLKCLNLDYIFNVQQLPTSLVKLELQDRGIQVTDLSYLVSLKELLVFSHVSRNVVTGVISLPQSIVRFEVWFNNVEDVEISLLNLKELIIHEAIPTNITEQNFPALKFIQLIKPDEDSLSDSPLSPTKLMDQGLIKSVKFIKNEYLVELSCFPWWVQYSARRYLVDIFRDCLDVNFSFI